ncbi:MAG: hypothetical protein HY270_17595 [Deltaproteobacteria bacterium]|nr:hypothetical protein [Deltaproteobacteria bacterium]
MSLDHILLWLSAKGQGSWSQFRAAVEELHSQENTSLPDEPGDEGEHAGADSDLPLYQRVRFTLQRLGHVEFFAGQTEKSWRVVPPAVAFASDASVSGLLCGARSPALFERLDQIDDVEVLASQVEGMPQLVLVRGATQCMVCERAATIGFRIQRAAPMTILSAIPSVRDPVAWHRSSIPETPGWLVHRFSVSRRQWVEVPPADARSAQMGLFRFIMKHQRFYYLRWRNDSYQVPVQVGKYAILRKRRGIIAYDAGHQVLSTPAVFRPPLLMERAVILCSGRLPQFDAPSGRVEYSEVPHHVAQFAAQLLQQEI